LISSYLEVSIAKFKYMFLLKSKILKKEKGASAVEFALILMPFIVLMFAIFQFGIVFNNWIALNYAAREGVRLAAVYEDEAFIKGEVIKRAPSVKIDPDNILITNLNGEIGTPVTVTVTGSKIDLNFLALSKEVVLSSSATLRIENR
jgi:Flp pilus assembly protein TadG